VHVSNSALLLPCAFPAVEEEAEAGRRGESGALGSRDKLCAGGSCAPIGKRHRRGVKVSLGPGALPSQAPSDLS